MLKRLYINNYAIIDELAVDFTPHFNSITGETGAGKSILMGALGLVLGQRADSNVLRNDQKKCTVEATFVNRQSSIENVNRESSVVGSSPIEDNAHDLRFATHVDDPGLNTGGIERFFMEQDLDLEETITIRREITTNGKSRGFINDTPVNLAQLRELTSMLVDMHQQFDTLELGDDDFQRQVLDALANHGELLDRYAAIYKKYTAEKKQLLLLIEQQSSANKESDYHQFLFNELEEMGLKENELEQLEGELQLLGNAENVKLVLSAATFGLNESETPIVQQLKTILQQINGLKSTYPDILLLVERLQSAQIELMDIAEELGRINDSTGLDPERLQAANERLDMGYRLLKKHGVQTTAQLLAIQHGLSDKLQQVLNIGDVISAKEKDLKMLLEEATTLAGKISYNRKKVAQPLETKTAILLKQVGMPNAQIKVEILPTTLQTHGTDQIQFLFDGNKSGRFEPLRKVASGGELSRLMLAIKSIVAGSMQLPTLIFDEIDSGISGEAARQVGIIMKELASRHQVIAITHQPQVAAKADAHYFVYKREKDGSVQTQMKLLGNNERVDIIANMLAGENPSQTVLQNAREMMGIE